ncbi:CapA family protein [Streptomyces sp. NPDC048241]|uniref:CapA family protein n=1 Tax=Streptomyces sp. NPDC048241 TaxID=3365521 RepID=UPI003720A4CE
MIGRRHQVALALTAALAALAACQNQDRAEPGASGQPAPGAGKGFTLVAAGGVQPYASAVDRAGFDASGAGHDFRPMLAGARPAVSGADLALCHLEPVQGADGDPAVIALPQLAQGLAATGYDSCSTASPQADGAGVTRTLNALDQAGVRHAGTSRTDTEARTVTLLRAGTAKVAHLSYAYDTTGQSGAVDPADAGRIAAAARAARQAGADVVVLSVNWGSAWQDTPDAGQVTLAKQLTAAKTAGRPDIDLVLGDHAHVPQPFEKVNGTWVVYGMGDQIADGGAGAGEWRGNESTLARFTFAPPAKPGGRWEVRSAEFLPQVYDLDAGRAIDMNRAIAAGADLAATRDRVAHTVLGRNATKAGLTMAQ